VVSDRLTDYSGVVSRGGSTASSHRLFCALGVAGPLSAQHARTQSDANQTSRLGLPAYHRDTCVTLVVTEYGADLQGKTDAPGYWRC
jgi:hypothetical protein